MIDSSVIMGMLGGWTVQDAVTDEYQKVFQKALDGFTGGAYTPLAVATQVVKGMNYCFNCSYKMTTNPPIEGFALVYIYLEAGKTDPVITKIKRLI